MRAIIITMTIAAFVLPCSLFANDVPFVVNDVTIQDVNPDQDVEGNIKIRFIGTEEQECIRFIRPTNVSMDIDNNSIYVDFDLPADQGIKDENIVSCMSIGPNYSHVILPLVEGYFMVHINGTGIGELSIDRDFVDYQAIPIKRY